MNLRSLPREQSEETVKKKTKGIARKTNIGHVCVCAAETDGGFNAIVSRELHCALWRRHTKKREIETLCQSFVCQNGSPTSRWERYRVPTWGLVYTRSFFCQCNHKKRHGLFENVSFLPQKLRSLSKKHCSISIAQSRRCSLEAQRCSSSTLHDERTSSNSVNWSFSEKKYCQNSWHCFASHRCVFVYIMGWQKDNLLHLIILLKRHIKRRKIFGIQSKDARESLWHFLPSVRIS